MIGNSAPSGSQGGNSSGGRRQGRERRRSGGGGGQGRRNREQDSLETRQYYAHLAIQTLSVTFLSFLAF